MSKPRPSDIVYKAIGHEVIAAAPGQSPSKGGPKLHLSVTPHFLHIDDHRTIAVADLRHVGLLNAQTIEIQSAGLQRPFIADLSSADQARRLRAALVFFGQQSRGGPPGVSNWKQLLTSPYDRLDVLDKAIPSAAPSSMLVGGAGQYTGHNATGSSSTRKRIVIAAAVAVLLIAGGATALIMRSSSQANSLEGLSIDQLRQQAEEAFGDADHDAALQRYQMLAGHGVAEAIVFRRQGQSLIALKRHEDAVKPLRRAVFLNRNSGDVEDILLLAGVFRHLRQYERAMEVLRAGLRDNHNNLLLHLESVRVLEAMNALSQAMAASGVIHQMHPEHVENSLNYARLLDTDGRQHDALIVYMGIINDHGVQPAYIGAIRLMGKLAMFDDAEILIGQAQRRFPQANELRGDWRRVLTGMGIKVPAPPRPEPEPEPDHQPAPVPDVHPAPLPPDGTVPLPTPDDTAPVAPGDTAPVLPEGTSPAVPDATVPPIPDLNAPHMPDHAVPAETPGDEGDADGDSADTDEH